MTPVSSNAIDKNCSNPIGSDCVTMSVDIPGTCKGASLSQAMTVITKNIDNCCGGSFPLGHQSCYTGNWVDITSSIPPSGLASGLMPYSLTGVSVQYKWESNGDLVFRGGFQNITFTPNYNNEQVGITLATIPITCLPTNATSKWVTLGGQGIIINDQLNVINFYLQFDMSTGSIILAILYVGRVSGSAVSLGVSGVTYGLSFDSARFNF